MRLRLGRGKNGQRPEHWPKRAEACCPIGEGKTLSNMSFPVGFHHAPRQRVQIDPFDAGVKWVPMKNNTQKPTHPSGRVRVDRAFTDERDERTEHRQNVTPRADKNKYSTRRFGSKGHCHTSMPCPPLPFDRAPLYHGCRAFLVDRSSAGSRSFCIVFMILSAACPPKITTMNAAFVFSSTNITIIFAKLALQLCPRRTSA